MQKPIYIQIKEQLLEEIKNLSANTAIESERVLSEKYKASRMTIRKAVDILVDEGYLYRNKNLGTFVTDRSLTQKQPTNVILDDYDNNKILYFNIKTPDNEFRDIFKIDPNELIVRVAKSNFKNGLVVSIDDIYYVKNHIPKADVNNISKLVDFSKLMKEGLLKQRFIPISVPINYSNILKVRVGTPIIMVESIIKNPRGEVVAFVRSYNNPKEKIIEITT